MLGTPSITGTGFYNPQGIEFAHIAQQVAGETAQVLPGLISGLLWSHPQIRQQTLQSATSSPFGYGMQGVNGFGWPGVSSLQGQFGFTNQQSFNPGMQTFFGGISPQQQNIVGQIAQEVAWAAAQALPVVISGLLSSHLQLRQQNMQFGNSWQQAYEVPSSFSTYGISPFQALNTTPFQTQNIGQIVQQALAHQLGQQTSQFGGAYPQGYGFQGGYGYGINSLNPSQQDLSNLVQQAVAHQIRQQTMQFGGVSPQVYGMSTGSFGTTPQQQELSHLTHQISNLVAQQIPNIVTGALSSIAGLRL
jgi:hypothetical protein